MALAPHIYILIEINYWLALETIVLAKGPFPECLQKYLDVFIANNTKKLAPY